MKASGCKKGKEMELSYKANKEIIYLLQLLPLEQSQACHVGRCKMSSNTLWARCQNFSSGH